MARVSMMVLALSLTAATCLGEGAFARTDDKKAAQEPHPAAHPAEPARPAAAAAHAPEAPHAPAAGPANLPHGAAPQPAGNASHPQANGGAAAHTGPAHPAEPAHPHEADRPVEAGQTHAASAGHPGEAAHAGVAGHGAEAAKTAAHAGDHPAGAQHGSLVHSGNDHGVRDPAKQKEFARAHEHDFHTSDVRDFNHAELSRWQGGSWHDGWYDGHWGWYWEVAGVPYWYDAPIYPYPLVVAPLYVETPVVVPVMLPMAPIQPLPAAPVVAYHCAAPEGLYPTIAACAGGWQELPLVAP